MNNIINYIKQRITNSIDIAVVTGSGLSDIKNILKDSIVINYADIPGYFNTTVKGHDGAFYFGNFNGKNIDEIKFDDNEVIKFRQNIGIMSSLSQLLPNINVKQNIMLPATIFEEERSKDYEKLISQLNIKKIQNNSISSLSSGEKQRVLLARALILSPLLLIADEPTANLDNNNALKIGDIMSDLNEENKTTIIIATHDDKISNKTKSILKIENGNLSKEI